MQYFTGSRGKRLLLEAFKIGVYLFLPAAITIYAMNPVNLERISERYKFVNYPVKEKNEKSLMERMEDELRIKKSETGK